MIIAHMNYLLKLPLLAGLNQTALIVIIAVAAALLIGGGILLFVLLSKRKKNSDVGGGNEWLEALGGRENVVEMTAVGSRLSFKLQNNEAIDREKLKELGVTSVLVMSGKVTLVIEGKALMISKVINESLLG